MSDQEQTSDTSEDSGSDDTEDSTESSDSTEDSTESSDSTEDSTEADDDEGPASDERLDELGDKIQAARAHAEENVDLDPDEEPGQEFHESGEEGKEEDDQTIAPPG